MDISVYRLDVVGFAENVCGVGLHKGQKRILRKAFPIGMEPEFWQFKFIHLATGNRFGKSVILAILHLWFAVYKHRAPFGYGTPEWFDLQYSIINLCPLNEIAYVVREKVGLILMDQADEQIKKVGGRGHVAAELVLLFKKADKGSKDKSGNPFLVMIPDTEYKGYVTKHNVYLEYRTADDHGKAVQGRKKYLITFDEAGRHKDPEGLIGSDIAPRTIDSRGIIVTATTPHLETESNFEAVWERGNPENPDKGRFTISFRGSMRDNPHVTPQMIEESLEDQPEYLWSQIIDGAFIQSADAFFNSDSIKRAMVKIPNQRRRARGHEYIIGWDLAIAKDGDRSIGIVIDVSTNPCKVVEYLELPKGTQHPIIVDHMRRQLEWYHNEKAGTTARLVFDATGMGGLMFKTEVSVLYPRPKGFDFTSKLNKKLQILQTTRMLFSKRFLVFPASCTRLFYELKHYVLKDLNKETDSVMAIAPSAHMVERTRGRLAGTNMIGGGLAA